MKTISKIIMTGVIFTCISALCACGTVRGVGQDVSATGHAISRSAS